MCAGLSEWDERGGPRARCRWGLYRLGWAWGYGRVKLGMGMGGVHSRLDEGRDV
jgi:hypothetical protein